MIAPKLSAVFLVLFLAGGQYASAFTSEKLPVKFMKYQEETFALAKERNKPVFMLISAEWCRWCQVFEEEALSTTKVYSYLNKNFINVFIDADVRSDLHARYKADVLPYVVFLNPDSSILHKVGGAMDAGNFLKLIKYLHKQAVSEKPDGAIKDVVKASYSPPSKMAADALSDLHANLNETE